MRAYLKFMLALYVSALLAAMALRVIFKLWYIDPATGFYLRGPVTSAPVQIFNALVAAVPIIMFISSRLKRADGDFPLLVESRGCCVLALLTGLSLLGFATIGRPAVWLEQGYSPRTVEITGYLNLALGVLAALAFLYLGANGMFNRQKPPFGIILIFPPIWQVVALVTRFNSYTTVTAITDHLLAVLFMVFSSLFLIGQARTLCGHIRKDGRNYSIPSGLCCSLFGFLLVIPNLAYMAVNRLTAPPTAMLGNFECAYVLFLSVYALVFAVQLARSIKKV